MRQFVEAELLPQSKPTFVYPDWTPLRPTWTSIIRPEKGMTSEDFQATGTSAIISKPRHYNCDDMGLGKTKQMIDALRYVWFARECLPMRVLAIVKAGGLDFWRDEFLTEWAPGKGQHFPEASIFLIRGEAEERKAVFDDFIIQAAGCNVAIIGYENFRTHIDWFTAEGMFDWIIADEAHKLSSCPLNNAQAQVARLIHRVHAPRQTALSGTPIPDTPEDAWNVNTWLGFETRSWEQFKTDTLVTISFSPSKRRPGFKLEKVVNYKPDGLYRLRQLLGSGIMTRRTKNDELDLPGKVPVSRPVILNAEEARVYRQIAKSLLENEQGKLTVVAPLAKYDRLIQACSSLECFTNKPFESSKIRECLEILEEAGEQKVIYYSRFIPVLRGLYRSFKKFNPAFITGQSETTVKRGHDVSERREMELKFQQDPTCRVFLGSTAACMEQLSLTAGTVVVFLDKLWAPKQNEQAEDRANRIGTTSRVTVITLDAYLPGKKPKKTIDAYRNKRLEMKSKITNAILADEPMSYTQFESAIK